MRSALPALLLLAACQAAVDPSDAATPDSSRAQDDAGRLEGPFIPPGGGPVDAGRTSSDAGTVLASSRLAPISGGTLVIASDGNTAIAADSQRDVIFMLDVAATPPAAARQVALLAGDEPGRVVEGAPGTFYVALRRAGAIATLDLASATIVERRAVCPDPRGLAFDGASQRLHVACANGELVTLPAAGAGALRRLFLETDLRDVLLDGTGLLVSRFRSAELLQVDAQGAVTSRTAMPTLQSTSGGPATPFTASVAWRMVAMPSGGVAVVHQRGRTDAIDVSGQGGYLGGACKQGIVHGTVSLVTPGTTPVAQPVIFGMQLPVDLAISSDGQQLAMVGGSNDSVVITPIGGLSGNGECFFGKNLTIPGAIAVAFDGRGRAVVQSSAPSLTVVTPGSSGAAPTSSLLPLPGAKIGDDGHALFHRATPFGLACAGCHPEGREDGRVWNFKGTGPRRTQALWGGLLATAPFHWDGDLADLSVLMGEVFEKRMGGTKTTFDQVTALGGWLDQLPVPAQRPGIDAAAAARGQQLFESAGVGCTTCHSGAHFTNNKAFDVGTGGVLQVPSLLGVSARTPLMHNGCAPTLKDRFGSCGGDKHGTTAQLLPAEIDDLVSYLSTL